MPLPLGHAAIGITAVDFLSQDDSPKLHWKLFLFAAFLANLPDIDIVIGLILHGNGSFFHRGATHSLLFALVMGFLAANGWKLCPQLPKIGFWSGFLLIFSHIVTDILFTTSPVSLLWPFEIYHSTGFSGWLDVLNSVFFKAFRDAGIIISCVFLLFLKRLVCFNMNRKGISVKGTKIPVKQLVHINTKKQAIKRKER